MTTRQRPVSARRTGPTPDSDLRDQICQALKALLGDRRFDAITVADIITAAGVSRASFYFYFASKQAVLAELVQRAVAAGHVAAQPWVDRAEPAASALRNGVAAGAELWRDNAGVLKAIVEGSGSDDDLQRLWLDQMNSYTDAAVERVRDDPAVTRHLSAERVRAVCAALTWSGERLYYLAASGVPPFDDESTLVDTLTHLWTSSLYGTSPTPSTRRRRTPP